MMQHSLRSAIAAALCFVSIAASAVAASPEKDAGLEPLRYNDESLRVDLGVGLWAWPVPIDYDNDGDLDLVVSCPDKPYNGAWFFENVDGKQKLPLFKPGNRISKGLSNVSPSYVNGSVIVTTPGYVHPDFWKVGLDDAKKLSLPSNIHPNKVRANQWKYVDYDDDGKLDLVVGIEDWTEYGWDNAYDKSGKWTNGPLHGIVYLFRNTGTTKKPKYSEPEKVQADGKPVDTFGMPSPNFIDFDGDGDLDLLCGEFLDGFTYFENTGTRNKPKYAAGRRLVTDGRTVKMDLEMIVPVAIDWDGDGDVDLICGDEDGRVAFIENTGKLADGLPQFLAPQYFQQQASDVKCGALATPVGFDWDGDGDDDIVSGNSAGYIIFYENLSGKGIEQPKWAAPQKLEADGKVIRIEAGPNGSIQGPAEAKWGYTTISVADWDGDKLPDVIVNSIWGKVVWHKNVGSRTKPKLAAAEPIEVAWEGTPPKPAWTWWEVSGNELATQWRTTPMARDLDNDGLMDLVMLDHEGYLAWFQRAKQEGKLVLLPGRRVFVDEQGRALQLNPGIAGKSGRRKMSLVDWDGDGDLDLLINSRNVNLYRNLGQKSGAWVLRDEGELDDLQLAGHDTSPTTVDFNADGTPDLLVGAEDGRFYYKRHPQTNVVVTDEVVFKKPPFPSCHASTIVETKQGLVAAWFGGTKEGDDDVGIWVARREGEGWSEPVEVAIGVVDGESERHPCWNPVLYQPTNAPLMLFYKVGPRPHSWWGMRLTSDDGGRTWSKPERLPKGILGPIKNKPVALSGGSVLLPTSDESPVKPNLWRVYFEEMSADGSDFERGEFVNDGETWGAIQPSVLVHRDGRLEAVGRSRQGKVFQVWSDDNGKTWGPMTATNLPNPNSGTDAVTLKDGRHLIVYNHTTKGRSPLNVAISTDGKDWKMMHVLEDEPGEYSYPAVIQTSDGRVHITYTWKRTSIHHVVLDPEKL
jgi:predicted neuraminidase